jgi:4'-phosphopantetheinyl transferase
MALLFCEIGSQRTRLADGETHVYTGNLNESPDLRSHLTEEEQARAMRFRLERVRDQFIAARGRLRGLLGSYLDLTPRSVPVMYADGGKPYLPADYGLHFNVSHTEGLAVYALSRARVGVDVERERTFPDAEALVSRFFSRRECAEFQSLAPECRSAAFLRAWTRKEAVLKAIGRGVASLDCCEVTFGEDEPAALRSLDGDDSVGERWKLIPWQPAVGYQAVVAVEVDSGR